MIENMNFEENKFPKIIFVTGGVYSSVGKGLTLSNIGLILKELGFKVSALKFDPYLNLNAGNLSPIQHGEVYVTSDGYETDLDLGHYARFMNCNLYGLSCITSGTIYRRLLDRQNSNEFRGETIQVIPHVIDEIHAAMYEFIDKNPGLDFLFVEIGGTVGDLESEPFLEAAVRFQKKYTQIDVAFIHISPLIYLPFPQEFKTKPTQHSLRILASHRIVPDLLILRSSKFPDDKVKSKISVATQLAEEDIFVCVDNNIYLISEDLFERKIHEAILKKFNLAIPNTEVRHLRNFTNKVKAIKKHKLRLALASKYSTIIDSYISISESFRLAAYELSIDLEIDYLDVEKLFESSQTLSSYDAICVPYGFGTRGVEGKFRVIEYCRIHKIPFLGICFGMQLAVIEYARNVLNILDANSLEIDPSSNTPLFIPWPDLRMRLGSKFIILESGTLTHNLFKSDSISSIHRHRYFFNYKYLDLFKDSDLVFSAFSDEEGFRIVEMIELKNHPFFVASQFHPEFETNLNYVSPLFINLLKAGIEK